MSKPITPAIRARAEQLAEESAAWLPARSRVNGQRFYIVPSSTGSAAHYANFHGCTCKGFFHRGICAHVEAIRLVERRRMEEAAWQAENDALFAGYQKYEIEAAPVVVAEPVRRKSYQDLFPENDDAF